MQRAEYIAYLMSNVGGASCVDAGKVLQKSHDKVNRFLNKETFCGRDLFDAVCSGINLTGGSLTVDDSVLDKPYRSLLTTALMGYFYSGKHKTTVKGISLIVLVYTTSGGVSVPVNFRLYRYDERKTKNDYFLEMLSEVYRLVGSKIPTWLPHKTSPLGLRPSIVTMDSWYSSLKNLKFLRNLEVAFLVGLEKNRLVSDFPQAQDQIQAKDIPEDGLRVHLKGFDFVRVFRTDFRNEDARHYALYLPDNEVYNNWTGQQILDFFRERKLEHWQVELCFRGSKQVCNAERFFVRNTQAITNHIFCVLRAFQKLAFMAFHKVIPSFYALRKTLFLEAQRKFIESLVA